MDVYICSPWRNAYDAALWGPLNPRCNPRHVQSGRTWVQLCGSAPAGGLCGLPPTLQWLLSPLSVLIELSGVHGLEELSPGAALVVHALSSFTPAVRTGSPGAPSANSCWAAARAASRRGPSGATTACKGQ